MAAKYNDAEALRVLALQPKLPQPAARVWSAFQRLSGHRTPGQPWTWESLDAFLRLSGTELLPWEIELLEMLDQSWLTAVTAENFQPAIITETDGRSD